MSDDERDLSAVELEAVLQATAAGLYVLGDDGRLLLVNDALLRMAGLADADAARRLWAALRQGTPPPELTLLDDTGAVLPFAQWPLARARRDEPFHELEITVVGGARRWTGLFTGARVPRHGGVGPLFVITVHDVTATRAAEAALAASEERRRLAARATRDAIWDWGLDSGRVEWSSLALEHFGYEAPPGGFTYAWWRERIRLEDRDRVEASLRRFLAGNAEHWQEEYRFARADGTWADVFDRGYVVRDAAGGPVRMVGAMTDVSERRRAEAALRREQERLALAHRLAGSGAWDIDLANDGVWWSPELVALVGCVDGPTSVAEALALVVPDDVAGLTAPLPGLAADGGEYDVEFRVVHPEHGLRWLAALGHVTRDAEGRAVRLTGITLDVTERRRAAEERERLLALADAARAAAEQARDELGRMLERMSDGFLSFDREGRLTFANRRAAAVAGVAPEALLGRTAVELFPEIAGTRLEAALDRAFAEQTRETVLESLSGRWYEVRVYPSPEGMSLHVRDVTERIDAQEALLRRTDELRAITDAVPVMIAHVDAEQRYRFANGAFLRAVGRSSEGILGCHVREVLGEAGYAMCQPYAERALAGEAVRFERPVPSDGGEARVHDVRLVPHRAADGRVVGLYAVVIDITALKQAEAALRELNRSLEGRVAERTALLEEQAVRLRLLASELAGAEQRARRRMAELVHDHLQQLLVAARMRLAGAERIVRDDDALRLVEDAGAILADATEVSRSLAVDLQPPVLYDAGLGAALQWLAGWMREQHALEVSVAIEEGAEPPDEGTRALLFTAARELLFNVVKHAAVPRARLALRAARGRRIRLEVADGGVGFDLAGAGARAGFGLFGIRERLRAVGGDMTIRTRPGGGTSVALVVPPPPASVALSSADSR